MKCETKYSKVPHWVHCGGDPNCNHWLSPWDVFSEYTPKGPSNAAIVNYRLCVDCRFEIRAKDWRTIRKSGELLRPKPGVAWETEALRGLNG